MITAIPSECCSLQELAMDQMSAVIELVEIQAMLDPMIIAHECHPGMP